MKLRKDLVARLHKESEYLQGCLKDNPEKFKLWMAKDRKTFPEKREDLLPYLYRHTRKIIPFQSMCEGHNAPSDFIENILYGDQDVLGLACRSGGKTAQLGMACGLMVYPFENRLRGMPVRELGGSRDQSERVYEEFVEFLDSGYRDKIEGDVLRRRTSFQGGGRVEMLMQSRKSVRGPHVPRLLLDEIDEFEEKILNDSLSIPQSHMGISALVAMASTRHRPYGIMSRLFDEFSGIRLIWCIFEIMERCGEDYSCSTCNLSPHCPGKKAMENAVGYFTINDARNQRARIKDDDVYMADALCLKPRTEGSVYPQLDEEKHLVNVRVDINYPIKRSFDVGTDSPTVCGYWQIIPVDGRPQARQLDELRWRGKAPSVIVKEMLNHEREKGYTRIDETFVPMDAASFRAQLEDSSIGTSYPLQGANSVSDGIDTIRNLLMLDDNKVVGLVFDKETCVETFKEMEGYHFKDGKVVKKDDHGADAARYFCHSSPELALIARPPMAMIDIPLI